MKHWKLKLGLVAMLCIVASVVWAVDNMQLPLETQAAYGYNYKITVYGTNCNVLTSNTAAALFPQFNTPGTTYATGMRVRAAAVRVKTAFGANNGGITSCNIKLGDIGTDNARYLTAAIGTNITAGTWYCHTNTVPIVYNTATNLAITIQPLGAAITQLSNGVVDIYLDVRGLDDLNVN